MAFLRTLLILAVTLVCSAQIASAQIASGRKLALLVGNSDYSNLAADFQLVTPGNDVRAIGQKFTELGFEVVVRENLGRQEFLDTVLDFANKLTRGDIAVFYYAGHGVNFGSGNLFLPSDIPAPRAIGKGEEARIAANTISESQIKEVLGDVRPRVFFAIFDACRNNPLKVAGNTRSLGNQNGMVITQPEEGVAVLYSAGERQEALDRLREETPSPTLNSVFARVFLEQMSTPGQSLTQLGRNIQREVRQMARGEGHDQRPAFYDELGEDFYLVPGAAALPSAAGSSAAADDWELARASGDVGVIEAFLLKHGTDPLYRSLAERELQKLRNPILESLKLPETPATVAPAPAAPAPAAPAPKVAVLKPLADLLPADPKEKGWHAVVGSAASRQEALELIRRMQQPDQTGAAFALYLAPSPVHAGQFDVRFGSGDRGVLSISCLRFARDRQRCELGFDKALMDAEALCMDNGVSVQNATVENQAAAGLVTATIPSSTIADGAKSEFMINELARKNPAMLQAVCRSEITRATVSGFQQSLRAAGYLNWPVEDGVVDDQTRRAAARLYTFGL